LIRKRHCRRSFVAAALLPIPQRYFFLYLQNSLVILFFPLLSSFSPQITAHKALANYQSVTEYTRQRTMGQRTMSYWHSDRAAVPMNFLPLVVGTGMRMIPRMRDTATISKHELFSSAT